MTATKKKTMPRGIRNNNPLNIRIGNTWLGEVPNPTDSDFEQFVSPVYGLRAAFVILRRYINRYHRDTLPLIIHAWAPSSENNTENYISFVSHAAGIDREQILSFDDSKTMCAMVKAMAKMETGVDLDENLIHESYKKA